MSIWGLTTSTTHWVYIHEAPLAAWLTVFFLGLAFFWGMYVEIPKLRRRLSLLSHKISRNTQYKNVDGEQVPDPWTRMDFAFSNTSRRPIKPLTFSVATYSGKEPSSKYFVGEVHELHEGQHSSGGVNFSGEHIEDNDLKSFVIKDSMNKDHEFYFYKGKPRNWWVYRVLYFLHIWR